MTLVSQIDAMHEQAAKLIGLDDFGANDYLEPLRLLMADHDRLGLRGTEPLTFGATVGSLVARLIAHDNFKRYPQYLQTKIEKPLIITGLPRTGSTSLHRLLAKDPHCQYLVPWLGNAPQPRPPRETWEQNPGYQMTHQGLEALYASAPVLRGMHPMQAGEADECRFAMEPSFWSPALAFSAVVGDYARWVEQSDARPAYAYYRKVLGLIAGDDRRQWILKDPTTHPWAPQRLLETFPDARIVWTHRDPATAIASVADMLLHARRQRAEVSVAQNGREHVQMWSVAIERLTRALEELPDSQIIHIHIDELQADPAGTAERIYRYFDMPVAEDTRAAWQNHARRDARSGHAEHHYRPEDAGVERAALEAQMPEYCARYRLRYGNAH